MLSVGEARARILSNLPAPKLERVVLADCAGRVLREDVFASRPAPAFDQSAMDGYAIFTGDIVGAPPWALPVVGSSAAGSWPSPLHRGTACRIFTGAPLPAHADAVIMQEAVTRSEGRVIIAQAPAVGQHIRRAGEDLTVGALALAAGTRLTAGAIALAAMLERGDLVVACRPRVTILCTGDELRLPGQAGLPATIPESNSAALSVLARQAGATVRVAPIVHDDLQSIRRAIDDAIDGTDVLVTVGGVSVGDHDHVRPALEQAGVNLDFWQVAMKPGKPLAVGSTPTARVLGLPGNPASALVTFAIFGMPLLRAMQGDACPQPMPLRVHLAADLNRSAQRVQFVRGSLHIEPGAMAARVDGNQASGAATSLARSDGLLVVPMGDGAVAAGTMVDFVRWTDV